MPTSKRFAFIPVILILALTGTGGWYLYQQQAAPANGSLHASGTIEATEIMIGPELGGRVSQVLVDQGATVKAGDPLFRLDDQVLQAQRKQTASSLAAAQSGQQAAQTGLDLAQASLATAQAALKTAQAGADAARIQYQITLNTARAAGLSTRNESWRQSQPNEFKEPVWYFSQTEVISATQVEVESAQNALQIAQSDYNSVLLNSSSDNLKAAANRLINAQAAFQVAKDVLDRANAQSDQNLKDNAQTLYDQAKSELDAAQSGYDRMLTSDASKNVSEVRSRLSIAQARFDAAQDRLAKLLTGDHALQVQAAQATRTQAEDAVEQAQAGLEQAQAGVAQAQAKLDQANATAQQAQSALDLIDLQLGKLQVSAPTNGTILSRSVEPGEIVQPASQVMTLGQLDQLKLTVYIPEDRYGEVKLGDKASVAVDSFPGKAFEAIVTRIADQAEFTPRNVQTVEGRRTTVYAIELTISNSNSQLKPGMPADVTFGG